MVGAWQIYEHSGNQTFLIKSYEFYKELFWDGIGGKHFGYGYQAVLCLNKMAAILGFPDDAIHWNATGHLILFCLFNKSCILRRPQKHTLKRYDRPNSLTFELPWLVLCN